MRGCRDTQCCVNLGGWRRICLKERLACVSDVMCWHHKKESTAEENFPMDENMKC